MAGSQPIMRKGSRQSAQGLTSSFAAPFLSSSPIAARQLLARDLDACSDENEDVSESEESYTQTDGPTLYRQPFGLAYPTGLAVLNGTGLDPLDEPVLNPLEQLRSRNAERSLLRDNHLLPPKHPVPEQLTLWQSLYRRLFSTKVPLPHDDIESRRPSETSPLLPETPGGSPDEHAIWDAAVAAEQIQTTWQREAQTLAVYSRSLIVTMFLQYSINVASVFAVGHIGKVELGAVSLAAMSANISCYAPIQGLCTCLDTLCSQAYGSGRKHLVGLQMQRMTWFLFTLIVFIAALWLNAEPILNRLVPETRSAELAAQYLRITVLGIPAVCLFESGKRFVQSQGLFHATLHVLLVVAPLNILMNWLFVWQWGWGFMGAPVAVVISQNLLPLLLFLWVWRIDGSQCWAGFSSRALSNWGPMIKLAIPGMLMVEAEWLAFEILTLAAASFGTSYLAAQSVLVTFGSMTFQLPFPLSVSGSTRVAVLIGAKLVQAAKTSAKVTFVGGIAIGLINFLIFIIFRYQIASIFSKDPEVQEIVASVAPVVAILQFFDALATVSHGLLRGIGRQDIGGYSSLVSYYLIALPISLFTAFNLNWKLSGLWFGLTIGLTVVAIVEYWYIYFFRWERAVEEAQRRNG